MIKLLIVDDEELVREGIKKILGRDNRGFEIAGEASDGEEAEKIALQCLPDVIITDVRMPFVDGLTLIEHLRPKLTCTKFIVLSGYEDFSYVRQALRQGVIDYIVKPIGRDELYALLDKARAVIEEENEERKNKIEVNNILHESLIINREKILQEVILRKGSQESTDNLRRALKDSCFKHFVIELISLVFDSYTINNLCHVDREAFTVEFYNLIRKYIYNNDLGTVVMIGHDIIALLCFDNDEFNIFEVNTSLSKLVEERLKESVNISAGSICDLPDDIFMSFLIAQETEKYRFLCCKKGLLMPIDFKLRRSGEFILPLKYEKSIAGFVDMGERINARNIVTELMEYMKNENVYPDDMIYYVIKILDYVTSCVSDMGYDTEKLMLVRENLTDEMASSWNIEELACKFIDKVEYMVDLVNSKRNNSDRKIIDMAKNYIKRNYDNDIKLSVVAQNVYVNPKYLSDLFKKETGENFTDYIARIRMEKAKELLKQLDLKTYEVAEKVGYQSPKHFSKVFKKVVGITPMEYRERTK